MTLGDGRNAACVACVGRLSRLQGTPGDFAGFSGGVALRSGTLRVLRVGLHCVWVLSGRDLNLSTKNG